MRKISYKELEQSAVDFDPEYHRYTLEDKELQGVTSVLNSVLFYDKYQDVAEHLLMRAAEKGSKIHSECVISEIFPDTEEFEYKEEVLGYNKIKRDYNINMIANEYLVSDNEAFATQIDCVDDECNLYDIKTTYTLDKEYLSWQLSMGAYLFERTNPKLQVGRLFGIWLRGEKAELTEVPHKTDAEVEMILSLYTRGERKEKATLSPLSKEALREVERIEREIVAVKEFLKTLEERKERALSSIAQEMREKEISKFENDKLKISYIAETTSQRLDTKKLQNEKPELYAQYLSESIRKAYMKVTLQ